MAEITAEVVGAKKAIIALGRIDKQLRKQFNADVQQVMAPTVSAVKSAYRYVPLSGMSRKWAGPAVNGRKAFPFDPNKAKRGVRVKVDTGRSRTNVILVEQRDLGTAIFESAGRATDNKLGRSLGFLPAGRTRIIGRVVYGTSDLITRELQRLIVRVISRVEKELP